MVKIATYEYPVIYVYSIDDPKHKDLLKVGQTYIDAESPNMLEANCEELCEKAKVRINQQTGTASIDYKLLYTELAYFEKDGKKYHFGDHDVREVLAKSGYANAQLSNNNGAVANEWVKVNDVEIVKKAITAVKEQRASLDTNDFKKPEPTAPVVIKFRNEQSKAIEDTLARFNVGNKMLWNAKMRFGKTLCALEVIKRRQYRRTLIITHRPSVRSGWFEDFNLLGFGDDYYFGNKKVNMPEHSDADTPEQKRFKDWIETKVKDFETLELGAGNGELRYIYFASIQDLRGSWDKETGEYKKNKELFEADWDLLIVDEAHEGTKTDLGESVIAELQKHDKMRTLYLSGTPYNILNKFKSEEIYSWTYEMEQEAKQRWYKEHPDETNPYEDLPRLELYTYNMDKVFNYDHDEESDFFNFAEFFRVDKVSGNFVHENDVKKFLDLMCTDNKDSNYPYSTEVYRAALSHTLWVLPGVAEAAALSRLIRKHNTLKQYYVINVAGDGDDDQDNSDSVRNVKDNIATHDRTITLTCGRLTTGVSIPEWSAVFMLCGGAKISAAFYLQTIFRAQTPTRRHDFPKKKVCYAFDFAPDRTIEVVNEYIDQQRRSSQKKSTVHREAFIENTLRFMPVIAYDGSQERQYDTVSFMQDVGKAYKDRIRRRGFRDRSLFVDLARLTDAQYRAIGEIGLKMARSGHVSGADSGSSEGLVKLAQAGLDDTQKGNKSTEKGGKDKNGKKEKPPKTPGAKKPVDKSKAAFKVLGDILIRLPMLIFGCDLKDTDITLQRIIDEVDEESWSIFMPKGVGKEEMETLIDLDVLNEYRFASAASEIPAEIEAADKLPVTERVKAMASMIACFRFPDKETVLTPWRVVNMHMSDTIGGYDFFDEKHEKELQEPRLVCHEGVTERIFKADAQVLEINSKSGLYPLYMAYSLYRKRISLPQTDMFAPSIDTDEGKLYVWDQVLRDNLYVLCMSDMAAKITHRVLAGYRDVKTNARSYLSGKDLVADIKNKKELPNVVARIKGKNNFWGNNKKDMNFDAIVGNPPYQETKGDNNRMKPVYHHFYNVAFELSNIVSLISPGRFLFRQGETPNEWIDKMLNDEHLKVVKYFINSTDVFSSVEIKGGVVICLRDTSQDFGKIGIFSAYEQMTSILAKVKPNSKLSLTDLISSQGLYKLTENAFNDFEDIGSLVGSGTGRKITSKYFSKTNLFSEEELHDGLKIYGLANNKRTYRWIKCEYLEKNKYLSTYNVFVPQANGSGTLGEILSTPIVGAPNVGHTDTFLSIGCFSTNLEAQFCLKYIKTKFARTMLGTLKVTQNNPRDTWSNVPLQDFTNNSDIDWTQSVSGIDKQLYKKYNLSDDEIAFIEKTIRPME